MDIIAIKQPDGSIKATSLKIKFGGLKIINPTEKNVEIYVNGVLNQLKLRLSQDGQVYIPYETRQLVSSSSVNRKNSFDSDSVQSNQGDSVLLIESPLVGVNVQEEDQQMNQIEELVLKEEKDELGEKNSKQSKESKEDHIETNESSFQINSEYKSRGESPLDFISSLEMSNCWNILQSSKTPEEDFQKRIIKKEEFFKDPWLILNSKNLAFRYKNSYYNWKIVAPSLISSIVYGVPLPEMNIKNLTEDEKGLIGKLFGSKANSNIIKFDASVRKESGDKLSPSNKNKDKEKEKEKEKENKEHPPMMKTIIKKIYEFSDEQLKNMKLNYGNNSLRFHVKSKLQGEQLQEVNIFLWDYNDKIIISDIDGTITRTDFLGHVLPLFGKDWTHKGVVELFNSIVKNGYKILYLTARALSQAKSTKTYIKSIIQDKFTMPDGPIILSPDSLTVSFKREIIDRTPEIFKIGCLNEIVGLFPNDVFPFTAGFGNRETDSFSYRQVGIKESRIFIINEKGFITQKNKNLQTTYSNINEIIDIVFPSISGYNILDGNIDYFKPRMKNIDKMSIDELFK